MVRPRNVNRVKVEKEIPDWEQEEFESRSDIKRAAQAVTDLAETIAQMSEDQIKRLQLPQNFTEAVLLYKKIGKGPALKRQKLYLGKMLRDNEPLIVEIKEKLAEIELKKKQQNAHFHKLEQWRDRLIAEGDAALHELLQQYPQVDRQQIRQLMRNAQKEQQQNKPPKSSREIFQYLKSLEW
jgi:ribosome-associated protein